MVGQFDTHLLRTYLLCTGFIKINKTLPLLLRDSMSSPGKINEQQSENI